MKKSLILAAAVLPFLACGPQPHGTVELRPLLHTAHATQALKPTHDVDCMPLLQQVLDDAQVLQTTPAFKNLEATPEYEAVMNDAEALDKNNCEEDDTPVCGSLRKKYAADEDVMMKTSQFQTVQATPEYAKLQEDISEAQAVGCME